MKISFAAARVNAELTITQAATALGISVSTLSGYENGKVIPRADMLEKMSKLYGWPVENFRIEVKD